jgi:SOS-response transcriptional repressor LexA
MDSATAVKKIRSFYTRNKRLPTTRELADLCHYASQTASVKLIRKLVHLGFLAKDASGHLIPKNLFAIPHMGLIRAGHPIPADPLEGENLDLYQFILDLPAHTFCLTIRGDSMRDAGINEGDVVIVSKDQEPKHGDIVAACVDGEWTVKYLHKKGKNIFLVPANANYPTLQPKTSLTIAGVVVHVLRTYT